MLEKIKLLLGLAGNDSQDELLSYLLKSTVHKILSFCNIDELPAQLEYVAIEITIKSYRSQQADVNQDKVVKALTVGGVRTEFQDSKAGSGIDQVIDSYKQQLLRFKRTRMI